jgi:hypothetical protein
MPLVWKHDADKHLFLGVANGDVTRPKADAFLAAMVEKQALAGRKMLDAHKGSTSMTPDDFLSIAVRMRELHALGPMGPVAIVLPEGHYEGLHRALGLVASAKRPMRIFDTPVMAYRWLAKQDPADAPERTIGTEFEESARARALAAHIRKLARLASLEAGRLRPMPPGEDIIYRGTADLVHRGVPLNICVKQVGPAWEFKCCGPDRRMVAPLLTLPAEQIAGALAQGENPLKQTLKRIRSDVRAGRLAVPDFPGGAT